MLLPLERVLASDMSALSPVALESDTGCTAGGCLASQTLMLPQRSETWLGDLMCRIVGVSHGPWPLQGALVSGLVSGRSVRSGLGFCVLAQASIVSSADAVKAYGQGPA